MQANNGGGGSIPGRRTSKCEETLKKKEQCQFYLIDFYEDHMR